MDNVLGNEKNQKKIAVEFFHHFVNDERHYNN